jgi:hypothetical protein
MGAGQGKNRRAKAKLGTSSPLRAAKNTPNLAALDGLNQPERKLARKIFGNPQPVAYRDGIPQYTVRAERFAKLLEEERGVPTWNKIFGAYKQLMLNPVFTLENSDERNRRKTVGKNHEPLPITELDLKEIDFSELTLQDVRFSRCDLEGSNFSSSKLGAQHSPVVFDCCHLKGSDFGNTFQRLFENECRYRTKPEEPMVLVNSGDSLSLHQFLVGVGALTTKQKEEREAKQAAETRLHELGARETPSRVTF